MTAYMRRCSVVGLKQQRSPLVLDIHNDNLAFFVYFVAFGMFESN
jgi:hypothetical protein